MKKTLNILLFLFASSVILAQGEQPKDSVTTEVVNVVTSYAPKVTDAFKIKKKPVIELSKNSEKKKLEYQPISLPVASTFIPKSGTLKPIKIGERERLFDNYFSLGLGNRFNPFLEAYMHQNINFDSEYKLNVKLNVSNDPVDTPLSSSFYNFDLDLYYKQIARYFDWKVGFIAERDKYNWYGLSKDISYTEAVISNIEPKQFYKDYEFYGALEFSDSYLKDGLFSVNFFSDDYENDEIDTNINVGFSFPLGRFGINSEDLQLDFSTGYLTGGFGPFNDYNNLATDTEYGFLNIGIHPYYEFNAYNFDIRVGAKGYFSVDTKNKSSQFLAYPDITISYPIIKQFANLYVGAIGDIHNNSYSSLTDVNPYVSPTLNIAQTNEVYNAYAGIKGILDRTLNYNFKARYSQEKSKPFFLLNQSKSDGFNTTSSIVTSISSVENGVSYEAYEYGNSFNVVYDDVQTLAFIGEAEYDFSKKVSLGLSLEYNLYTLKNFDEAWGLPAINGDIYGVYKDDKWYAGANIYYVGNRKGISYNQNVIGDFSVTDIDGYLDINFNGGYHVNSLFSVFAKANNITNTNYQRYQNFDTQGIQVLAGFIWKFDSVFF